jgi:hypothetical protein
VQLNFSFCTLYSLSPNFEVFLPEPPGPLKIKKRSKVDAMLKST